MWFSQRRSFPLPVEDKSRTGDISDPVQSERDVLQRPSAPLELGGGALAEGTTPAHVEGAATAWPAFYCALWPPWRPEPAVRERSASESAPRPSTPSSGEAAESAAPLWECTPSPPRRPSAAPSPLSPNFTNPPWEKEKVDRCGITTHVLFHSAVDRPAARPAPETPERERSRR